MPVSGVSAAAVADTDIGTTDPADGIIYKEDKKSYGTFVLVHGAGDERPALDWRPDSKRLSIRWHGQMNMSRQVEILQKLLAFLVKRESEGIVHARLVMSMDWYTMPDYAGRLAAFAAGDAKWMKLQKKALPRGTDPAFILHTYIRETTEAQQLLPELGLIFQPLGIHPRLVHVEKCSVSRSGNATEVGRMLRDMGIRKRMKLPVGCLMATFELSPENLVENAEN